MYCSERMAAATAAAVVQRSRVVTVMVLLVIAGIINASAAGSPAIAESDVCADDGAGLQCPEGRVVHVLGALCSDGRDQACALGVQDTLIRLCQGRASCARLGLRNVMGMHCHSPAAKSGSVVVKFTCEQAPSPGPACRANLCSSATQGLSCPQGSVLHVQNLTCRDGLDPCSPATFLTLYSLCEGRRECDASGLRMLTQLSMYCGEDEESKDSSSSSASPAAAASSSPARSNIFIDYLCVPNELIRSMCNGQYTNLQTAFGVLMNPGFVQRVSSSGMQCNWIVQNIKGSELHLTVHMAYTKWSHNNCTTHFLQVGYKDCDTSELKTNQYCNLRHVNSPVKSCGPVYVTSWLPAASDQVDRFLVSYQIVPKGSGRQNPVGMAECRTPYVTPQPTVLTTRPNVVRRNYGPGGTMFDYSDTIRQTAEDENTDEHPAAATVQFKRIILYVFFGVVIIALVIALVYVLISYRDISRRGRHPGDSSEKAALWRHDDTPLDTFNHNSHSSLADSTTATTTTTTNAHKVSGSSNNHHSSNGGGGSGITTTTASPDNKVRNSVGYGRSAGSPDSQVVACTVHATESHDDDDMACNQRMSGFSSFLPSKDSSDLSDLLANVSPYSTVSPDGPRGGTLPRRWSGESSGSGGANRNSTRSSSFKVNGDLGNIYEAIDGQQFHSLHRNHGSTRNATSPTGSHHLHRSVSGEHSPLVQQQQQQHPHHHHHHNNNNSNHHHNHHHSSNNSHHHNQQQQPLPSPPPSPPLPPPPPPIAEDYADIDGADADGDDPNRIDHYMVNNDEYALVRKPKNRGSPMKAAVSPTRRSPQYSNVPGALAADGAGGGGGGAGGHGGGCGAPNGGCCPSMDGPDPTYDTVDIFRTNSSKAGSGGKVGFRPNSSSSKSGSSGKDRNSRSEPVSPSSAGTSRYRWDEV